MTETPEVHSLTDEVMRSDKYSQLAGTLVSRITQDEAKKYKNQQAIVHATRTRLHRLTGAYLAPKLDYAQWLNIYKSLDPNDPQALESTSLNMMRLHASTSERLSFLPTFYQRCLASIAPVSSVLDLACGLNPLSIPWMPVANDFTYIAGDVVRPMVQFLSSYFELRGIHGTAEMLDLSDSVPSQPVQLALLMKTLPLMEQIERGLSKKILENLNAEHILVSYPIRSLGGRQKGMEETYRSQFDDLIAGRSWQVQGYRFPNEVAFLISK